MRFPAFLVALALAGSAGAAVPSTERTALVALYQSTKGASWTDKTNWLGATGTECTWFGVHCDESQGHVTSLELYQNNLDGTLPSELSALPALETFYAQNNHLTGKIPSSWGALKKLVYLDASGNELTGPLPAQLGDMTALKELILSYNAITGSIPKELGNLANLTFLSLGSNQLTGPIPKELASLGKLEILSINTNQLSGAIPAELGNLPAIVDLDLANNALTGGVQKALSNLKTLEVLGLRNNPLGGTIPKELGGFAAIQSIDLTETQLKGTIPAEIWELDTLTRLELSANSLTGPISADVAKLTHLEKLSLYGNGFTGTIPAVLGDIAPLQFLELANNELTGSIPPELSRLANLFALDLSGNKLTGEIPRQFGALTNLEELSLYDNQLTGAIPAELGQLAKLRILFLGGNRLTGTIPDALRNLTHLEKLTANGNQLTGSIPPWIGELKQLDDLRLGSNRLRGIVPQGLEGLDRLEILDLGDNELSGRFPDLSRMKDLQYLTCNNNFFTGPLAPGMGGLTRLVEVRLYDNALSGPLPRELGGLTSVEYFNIANNSFEGPIPPELGNLPNVHTIVLAANRLSGTIPKELGNLPNLLYLDLASNALRGPIPKELTKLTKLAGLDLNVNALFTADQALRAFINSKQDGGDFEATQTVTPTAVRVVQVTDRNATLAWTPIRYTDQAGGYQVLVSTSPGSAPVAVATTSSKEIASITVRNLQPATQYFFTVAAVTHPHDFQKNLLVSDPTQPLAGASGQRVVAPAEVVIVEQPTGLVRIDGAEVVADHFTVTNFGDLATNLTLDREGDFFTVSPGSFTLGAGATQVVTLRSVARDPSSYTGRVLVRGNGTDDDSIAYVEMLAATRPAGTVVAQPLAATVEVAGVPGVDSVGTAQFRNTGTAPLVGIVLSDQPWVEPPRTRITIDPGSVGTINFKIIRSRRPASEGALVANLRLVYVTGGSFVRGGIDPLGGAPGLGVSVSIVTVVDTTQPAVTTGSIPAPSFGELPLFIPGMVSSTSTRSDLALFNSLGSSIGDLKLYFTRGGTTSIAALQPLGASSALNLVNLVDSVYDIAGSGTVQVRTEDWQSVGADAKVTAISPEGTRGGAIPVFRGDRSIGVGETLSLVGLAAPGDVLLQETGGASAAAHVEFLDAAGTVVGTRDTLLNRYELVEWTAAVPANAVAAIVSSISGSFTAYARLRDTAGDVWSVVDWSRFYRYARNTAVRVPFADGRSGPAKRRVVRNDAEARFSTSLVLFNPGSEEARVRIDTVATSGSTSTRDVTIATHATQTLTDAASSSSSATAQLVITPTRGEVVATARSRATTGGTAIPVLSASTGLRLGQRQTFTALDDAALQKTSFGFAETSGASVTIRARIFIEGGNALVTTVTERDYALAPNAQLFVPELVRAFAGEARDSLGDLHNLVLELEVVSGGGSVVPFILATDEGTGDTSLRL